MDLPKHKSSSVKDGFGNVFRSAFMTASGKGSFIFIDGVTPDGSSRMNSEVYRNFLCSNLQRNASKLIRWIFIPQQDNNY